MTSPVSKLAPVLGAVVLVHAALWGALVFFSAPPRAPVRAPSVSVTLVTRTASTPPASRPRPAGTAIRPVPDPALSRPEPTPAGEPVAVPAAQADPVVPVAPGPELPPVASPGPESPPAPVTLGPVVPTAEVLGRIRYPVQARRQGIQATVELELLVEADGTIGQITVVKDPGWGFAAAAIAALDGVRCTPARVDGEPRAVRYRYPVRFVLTPAR